MSTIPQLTPAQFAAENSSAQVIDVREPDELTTGAIAGSTNIPLGQLSARIAEVDPSLPVVTVCQSGRRSQRAAEALAAAGFQVSNLDGGMNGWLDAGHPTV